MFCDQLAFPRAQVEVLSLQAAVWQLPRWLAVPTPCRRVSQRRGRPPGPALPGLAELRWPGGDWQGFGNTRTGQPGTCMQGLAGWASRGHRDVRFLLPTGNLQSVLQYLCTSRHSSSGFFLLLSLWLPQKLWPKNGKHCIWALRRIWVIQLKGRNTGPAHLTTGRDPQNGTLLFRWPWMLSSETQSPWSPYESYICGPVIGNYLF